VSATIDVVVHAVSAVSDRAMLVDLRRPEGRSLPAFEAGSHIDLHVDGLVRQYSILSSPLDAERYLVCIQRESEGRGGSVRLHNELHEGVRLRISEPRSMFPLAPSTTHSVLVGGGIGITPLLAMAETLTARNQPFELHCYARSQDAQPLREYIQARPFSGKTTFHASDEGDSARDRLPASLTDAAEGTTVYVCGPAGFIDHITAAALAAGWAPERVRAERFQRSTELTHTNDSDFVVHAASTGADYRVAAGQSIAQVLQANGIETSLSCEQGMCGSCLTDVLAGIPDHRDEVQTEVEKRTNVQLTICCSRSLTPRLELNI
jgi:vanillate O-demethylase ferredoxin subunit